MEVTEFLGVGTRALSRSAAPLAPGPRLRFVTMGVVFPGCWICVHSPGRSYKGGFMGPSGRGREGLKNHEELDGLAPPPQVQEHFCSRMLKVLLCCPPEWQLCLPQPPTLAEPPLCGAASTNSLSRQLTDDGRADWESLRTRGRW